MKKKMILIALILTIMVILSVAKLFDKPDSNIPSSKIKVVGVIDIPSCPTGFIPRINLETYHFECVEVMMFNLDIPKDSVIDKGEIFFTSK